MRERIEPEVGMAATISVGSDSYPATIVEVSSNRKTIKVQKDDAVRTDTNGFSESQTYEYSRNIFAHKDTFTLRKNGRWIRKGFDMNSGTPIWIGHRRKYWDPSF